MAKKGKQGKYAEPTRIAEPKHLVTVLSAPDHILIAVMQRGAVESGGFYKVPHDGSQPYKVSWNYE